MKLAVVMSHRLDGIIPICLYHTRKIRTLETMSSLCDCQCVIGMTFGEDQQLLPGQLGDVAFGFSYRDWKLLAKPENQCLTHDSHESSVFRRPALSLSNRGDKAKVIGFVTGFAKSDQIVRSVAASLPGLQVMDMEFDILLFGGMRSAALTGISITPKDILPDIVVSVHLTLLVVFSSRNRFTCLNSLQQLQVKLRSFNDYLADR